MDDTEAAFGPLHLRAAGVDGAGPADRISVRDYVREAEIGAFASERGVTQRLRFSVVLEVAHHAAASDDDVDKVVSYDMITRAIDRLLSDERVDLLETLAERLAQACLDDTRVSRAFVRVEKLDRIPGALGVEIVRARVGSKLPRLVRERPRNAPEQAPVDVIFLGREAIRLHGAAWLAAIAARGKPAITCLGAGGPVPASVTRNARRRGLLMVEAAALELADLNARFEVVGSRTEMEWSLESGVLPIWAPARMVETAQSAAPPDATAPADLAAWLCKVIGGRLVIVGSADEAVGDATRLAPDEPAALAAL